MQIKVPGASIYYEQRGEGPTLVMIPGGPTDAGTFGGLAAVMSAQFTCVPMDPRGNSRSMFDGGAAIDQDMAVHADDVAAVIDAVGNGPAYVLGSSGGAQIGLSLAARHPDKVRALVAHEPPCSELLPERSDIEAAYRDIVAVYHEKGVRPAMEAFAVLAHFDPPKPPTMSNLPPPIAEMMMRIGKNLDYFLGHGVIPISSFVPDVEALRTKRVVIGIGEESRPDQLPYRTATALAAALGVTPTMFPGDHTGFGAHAAAFAKVLAGCFARL